MGRYREALTRLFLAGAFPKRAGDEARGPAHVAFLAQTPKIETTAPAPVEPPSPREVRPAFAALALEPLRAAGDAARRAIPLRSLTSARKFRPATREEQMTHPGRILAQHLADLGMTASDLARDIDVPVNRVTGIINGQRGVTADTALRLGHWFGVDAEDWLELQFQHELALAREAFGAAVDALPRLVDRVA
jgi:antitoxin HigA-1